MNKKDKKKDDAKAIEKAKLEKKRKKEQERKEREEKKEKRLELDQWLEKKAMIDRMCKEEADKLKETEESLVKIAQKLDHEKKELMMS